MVFKAIKGIRDINGLDLALSGDTINVNTQVLNVRANEADDARARLVELLANRLPDSEANGAEPASGNGSGADG